MAEIIYDEDYNLDEPCLSCDKPYIEDIWNEWCCDVKVCPYKVKSEDKCMEELIIKKTVYVTDDGKRFDDLESAQEHEKHLEALEKLNSFKIDGPRFTPFDAYNCSAYNWQWYKVHDQNELQQVLGLAAKVYAMKNCSDDDDFNKVEFRFYDTLSVTYDWSYHDSEQKHKFPKYIAISFERECINTLDNIEKQHEIEMDKWRRFYRYFDNELKKDMESDDHYRGAQEEC